MIKRKVGVTLLSLVILIGGLTFYNNKISAYYQVDFSAYYAAAKSLTQGENPYYPTNYQENGTTFKHTAYLQFPIVANFFRPFAYLQYETAKQIWFLIQIFLLLGILSFYAKTGAKTLVYFAGIILLIPIFFYPLFAHWERGQTDLLVLFSIAWSKYLWEKDKNIWAGIVLGFGAIFKFPAYFLFCVPLAAKNHLFILGGVLAVSTLAISSIILDSHSLNNVYFLEYLPHLSKTGILPINVFETFKIFTEEVFKNGIVWIDKSYEIHAHFMAVSSSFTLFLKNQLGAKLGTLLGGMGLLFSFISVLYFLRQSNHLIVQDYAWCFIMLSILLFHPLTWIMNYVWVILISLILLKHLPQANLVILIAMLLIGFSDEWTRVLYSYGVVILNKLSAYCNISLLRHGLDYFIVDRVWLGGLILWSWLLYTIRLHCKTLKVESSPLIKTSV